MFIEVDDGVYVNLAQIFSIHYKSYQNKGVWVFSSSQIEESDRSLADKSNRKIHSRYFVSKEEAEIWLEEMLKPIGVVREERRLRRHQ
ncbi:MULTISPECIES: hypothetical protein [unclassified Oceanispirochaeta]|uniref:hypothetical protein n=1 Tax=unclassified Oceanispirochaeta TaxID=2635722 RepID=UPI000E091F97|nr:MULTISPECIES: hypothetical protein [unclassified Oceanispirochaeta]MBF9015622.1 hypothetical protein [Oceanispirochaeta sp. M2]NPD73396.1 hypothetical protein [Oceanispirochaeta sp. M1]RDG30870.1 hypothetical protein DV872_14940 [Oceanispirochaeta sp. M1]